MKAYTDIEQSKELTKILPIESADSHYVRKVTDFRGNPVDGKWSEPRYGNTNSKYAHYVVQNFSSYEKLPCWSLSALLNIIPFCSLRRFVDGNWIVAAEFSLNGYRESLPNKSAIDACVEMVLKLNELNLL